MKKSSTVVKVPKVTWSLGDREQLVLHDDVILEMRPLYYQPGVKRVRVGLISPDYADALIRVLTSKESS
jgi:hypothetical protein